MKAFILVLVAAVAVAQAYNVKDLAKAKPMTRPTKTNRLHPRTEKNSRIIAGQTAERGQFPHQAAVYLDGSAFCGGSLISTEWVLTAGHCVDGVSVWEIYLGAQVLDDTTEEGRVTVVTTNGILHEDYSSLLLWNDIGVVGLGTTVTTSEFIQTVNLPTTAQADESFFGEVATVSGWGKTSDASDVVSPTLQYTQLTVISDAVCLADYGITVLGGAFCARGEGTTSTCNGDSGGALVLGTVGDYTQIGVVSFVSSQGCESGLPDGFTRVTDQLAWISANTGIAIA